MHRWLLLFVFAAVATTGCGDTTGPTAVTKEVEEKLRAEERAANEEENSMPRADGSAAAKGKAKK